MASCFIHVSVSLTLQKFDSVEKLTLIYMYIQENYDIHYLSDISQFVLYM